MKKRRHGEGDRDSLLEAALDRRLCELEDLRKAFGSMLEGKKPLDPPINHGTAVQRAWLHSADPYDYRERLECLIDRAEAALAKLEERL
ncbi:hypothetical protein FBU30_000163 [Linnemannia zychae]|nr:hypothetical protein FBU30_000163 [Linnemannia zychae]